MGVERVCGNGRERGSLRECGKEVVKEAVECEVCERWFHIKCVGFAVGTYKVLMGQRNKSIGSAKDVIKG
jgi:hypothetical protein